MRAGAPAAAAELTGSARKAAQTAAAPRIVIKRCFFITHTFFIVFLLRSVFTFQDGCRVARVLLGRGWTWGRISRPACAAKGAEHSLRHSSGSGQQGTVALFCWVRSVGRAGVASQRLAGEHLMLFSCARYCEVQVLRAATSNSSSSEAATKNSGSRVRRKCCQRTDIRAVSVCDTRKSIPGSSGVLRE